MYISRTDATSNMLCLVKQLYTTKSQHCQYLFIIWKTTNNMHRIYTKRWSLQQQQV
jgi:hypothetical protein